MMETILIAAPEELKIVETAYDGLIRAIRVSMDDKDRNNIREAYEIALKAHANQRRKSGDPYILHPIAVARICAEEIGLGPTGIICALLHDVVEDTEITLAQIESKFGVRVAKIVDGLTKLDAAYNAESHQAENFKKVLSTLIDDVRVVLIKMADRLHNMRTLGFMERHKQFKIAAETSYIYAPLAHRLGLFNFKTEFLDLCMKITDAEAYQKIAKKLNETKKDREIYIDKFIAPLKEKLNELGFSYRIFGRPKSIYSIWNKIKTKKVEFEEVYDLFAVRIIIDVPAEIERISCWQAYSVVTDVHTPIADRLKDWITTPKSNGYESLHTTVIGPGGRFVEVQIRTERMDEISEKGYAAHWKYKGISSQPDVYERWLDSVRETIENPSANAIEFLVDFRANSLFKEEVYIYTPKGDVQLLPSGSTALDFAFHIHTDIGYHCTSIRVNNKLVPFGKVLKNGDQIQVHTSKNQKPSEDWLKMTTTGKAQAKIRSAMKEERKRKGEIGKEYLERKLKNLRVEFEESLEMILKVFDYKSSIDLYYDIATETRDIQDIFKRFHVENGKLKEITAPMVFPDTEKQGLEKKQALKPSEKPKLLVNGESADQYDYSLANCCNPLPGDDIFAFLTHNVGLKIHRSSCPNAAHLMVNYGYRILAASWQSTTDVNFIAEIKITGIDSGPGVIEQLSHQISSQLGLNIRSMVIEGDEGYFECRLKLVIKNTDQLHLVIRSLQALDNISSVVRLD